MRRLKIPEPKHGWKYATDREMLPVICERLANACVLNPVQVFAWAKKHSSYCSLMQALPHLLNYPERMELVTAVLNDEPLEIQE